MQWCGRQSADPLGEKSPQPTGLTEWNCTLADSVSVVVCMLVREPAIESVGGAAQARVSGLTCAISNFARNSRVITSNIEFVPLELQRFLVVSKNDRGKLRAKFFRLGAAVVCRHRG